MCCAGSRLLVQESIEDELIDGAAAAAGTLRVGHPLDKNTDVGAINSAAQLARIRALVDARRGRGRHPLVAAVRAARARLLVRAHGVHRRLAGLAHRAGGDLRAGAVGAHLPHARRGGGQGQQHAVRAVGRGVDREGLAHPVHGVAAAGRRGVGQHLQPLRPHRRRSAATRSPASAARADDTDWRPTSMSESTLAERAERLAVRKTYKLYLGGAFPRSESGPVLPGVDAEGRAARARGAGLAQGRARRRRRGPGGVRASGRRRRPTTAARSCTASPRCSRAGASSSPPRWPRPRAVRPAQRPRPGRRRDRPLGALRRLGRQVRAGRRLDQPGRRARTSTSRCPSPPAWSACWPRRSPRCSAWCRCSRRC